MRRLIVLLIVTLQTALLAGCGGDKPAGGSVAQDTGKLAPTVAQSASVVTDAVGLPTPSPVTTAGAVDAESSSAAPSASPVADPVTSQPPAPTEDLQEDSQQAMDDLNEALKELDQAVDDANKIIDELDGLE